VNWRHLRAFLWLRWRLLANQWRRGGALNAVLMTIVAVSALGAAVPLFVACFLFGLLVFPNAAPVHLLYLWDGLIVGFLFFWGIGLLTELQRTEALSLSKFLHLPVSIEAAFLINYLSSLVRLSLIIFMPIMFGLGLGLIFAKGLMLLSVLPLTAAFLLMVTALTYQFQGWLASLMSNPRRRRTVVVGATAFFILVFQLPNLLNVVRPWAGRESAAYWERTARLINLVLPIGWLPQGVMASAAGRIVPAMLGFVAMALIGAASLARAYRTTIRLYQGQFTARKGRPAPVVASPASSRKPRGHLLEARLPGLSEPVSAIALGGLRSLIRSPEAKMMLLTPVLLSGIFGAMMLRRPDAIPISVRPLIAVGAMGLVLFGVLQLMSNQFGFDRNGFRVFVLCAAPRRDILLGKNLAFAPLALGMAAIMLIIIQVACPMRLDHFLAMLPQFVSMFLLFCVLMNLLSIYAPLPIGAGSLKPANTKLVPVLLQVAMLSFVFPLTQAPTLLPLAIEAALAWKGWTAGLPICLLLSLAECAAVILIYRLLLSWQGSLFQAREQRILETVTGRAP
jgi:ABC-2 type transport system permease protein